MELAGQGRGRLSRGNAVRDVSIIIAEMLVAVAKKLGAVGLEIGDKRRGEFAGDTADKVLVTDGILQGKVG